MLFYKGISSQKVGSYKQNKQTKQTAWPFFADNLKITSLNYYTVLAP